MALLEARQRAIVKIDVPEGTGIKITVGGREVLPSPANPITGSSPFIVRRGGIHPLTSLPVAPSPVIDELARARNFAEERARQRGVTPDQKESNKYPSLTGFVGYLMKFYPVLSPRPEISDVDDASGFTHDTDANEQLLVIAPALFDENVPRRLVDEVADIVALELSNGIASGGAKVISGRLMVSEFGRHAQEILFYNIGTEPNVPFLQPSPPPEGTR